MRRMAALVVVVALAALAIPVAFAQFTDSGTFEYQITAADDFGGDESVEKVWVCKIVGSEGEYRLKDGENPLHVGVGSAEAEEGFADAHPSYIVDEGEECVWPLEEEETEESTADVRTAPATTEPAETITTVTDTTVSSTTSTTTVSSTIASSSTTTSSSTTSTTTTSTTLPDSTTTTAAEGEEGSEEEGDDDDD